jgi:diaminohydroxyphosphoribosylaminopyrimidine deaminase/5-amino-6-(5-phosphoribosylamino)uracil reductase
MISSNTLNIDNPKLNCRLIGYEKFSPKRIILDKDLDIGLNTHIFKSAKKNNTIIFHCSSDHSKINILKKKGITLIKSRLNFKKRFNLKIILKKLFSLGIRNLLVEGGEKITKNMLKNRLIHQFYLFESLKTLPKIKKHVIFTSNDILNRNYKVKTMISPKLVKDKITIYKR